MPQKENNKKILLVVPSLKQGGLQKVCVRTARLLEPYFTVVIAVFDGAHVFYDVKGLNVVYLNIPSKAGVWRKVINVFCRSWRLRKLKKEQRIDVSYGFGPTASISNVMAKYHDKIISGLRSYLDLQNEKRLKWYALKSDVILCCSREMLVRIQMLFPKMKADVLYNPYNIDEIEKLAREAIPCLPWETKVPDKEYKVIVSMGREDDVKGFWHLLKAFSEVRKKESIARLMIIGDGNFNEYKKLAQELSVADDVFFAGRQKNPYMYLKKAHVYVLTSLNEGFPNALVEAMSLSIPVIATNCKTGPAEILLQNYKELALDTYSDVDYGILIPELSQEKNMDAKVIEKSDEIIAKAILSLLEDSGKYEYYQKQAFERAKDFSDELYVEKFIDIVQK